MRLAGPPARTLPQVLGAAVPQDGDEGLLVGAELLLAGLEEDLQGRGAQQREGAAWQLNITGDHQNRWVGEMAGGHLL